MSIKNKLKEVVEYLNENYNQESENYCIVNGPKQEIIRYDPNTASSFWGCGAIVCIGDLIYFVSEDDGFWWTNEDTKHGQCATAGCFSIGWAESFANAMMRLKEYVEKNGTPVYYSGIPEKIIAHYTL